MLGQEYLSAIGIGDRRLLSLDEASHTDRQLLLSSKLCPGRLAGKADNLQHAEGSSSPMASVEDPNFLVCRRNESRRHGCLIPQWNWNSFQTYIATLIVHWIFNKVAIFKSYSQFGNWTLIYAKQLTGSGTEISRTWLWGYESCVKTLAPVASSQSHSWMMLDVYSPVQKW